MSFYGDINIGELKVPFKCRNQYYTVRTLVEKTETQEPVMRNWRTS